MAAAVVLAAGLSRRMGRPKLLLTLGGQPVIRLTVERVVGSGLSPVVVVTGPEFEALSVALAGLPVDLVVNPTPDTGQASSIRVGVASLPDSVDAALIVLGDQPFVPDFVIAGLIAAQARTGKPIVAPRYRDGRGNPVLFTRAVFRELLRIEGDQGARGVVERDAARVALVELDCAMPSDLDTPEDYARLCSPRETR